MQAFLRNLRVVGPGDGVPGASLRLGEGGAACPLPFLVYLAPGVGSPGPFVVKKWGGGIIIYIRPGAWGPRAHLKDREAKCPPFVIK